MRVGVLGTGGVGQTLAAKIASLGHQVVMGTRDVQAALARKEAGWGAEPLADWHAKHGDVKLGTFAEAAVHAEIVFNATLGAASLDALQAAGAENLDGKVLVTWPTLSTSRAACRRPCPSAMPTPWPSRSSGAFPERRS
jgi:8-hydroxy-5-deazaflavin:NADPH oxidoreductase